jgi:hypothetical protein
MLHGQLQKVTGLKRKVMNLHEGFRLINRSFTSLCAELGLKATHKSDQHAHQRCSLLLLELPKESTLIQLLHIDP